MEGKGIVIKETKPYEYMGVEYFWAEEKSIEIVEYKGEIPVEMANILEWTMEEEWQPEMGENWKLEQLT